MVLSSRGSLLFSVSEVILAVLKKKGAVFTPDVKLAFWDISGGKVIETGVLLDLVHLFDILITFRFARLDLICDPEYLSTKKVLISSSNPSSIASRMSLLVLFVVASKFFDRVVFILKSRLNKDSIVDHSLFIIKDVPCYCAVP